MIIASNSRLLSHINKKINAAYFCFWTAKCFTNNSPILGKWLRATVFNHLNFENFVTNKQTIKVAQSKLLYARLSKQFNFSLWLLMDVPICYVSNSGDELLLLQIYDFKKIDLLGPLEGKLLKSNPEYCRQFLSSN